MAERQYQIGYVVQAGEIMHHQFFAPSIGLGQFGELDETESGAHFIDAVVETGFHHIVCGGPALHAVKTGHRHAVGAEILALLKESRIAGGDHAPLPYREILVGEETPGRHIAKCSQLSSFISATVGVGAILDESELVSATDVDDGVHVASVARIVYDHDSPSLRRDLGLDIDRIHSPVGGGGHVGQDNIGSRDADRIEIGNEGEGGNYHFVPGFHAAGEHRDMECRRTVGHGHTT